MRLIDADELLKSTNKDGAYGYVSTKEIEEAPTAFDAEAVVKKLEELRDADVDECTEYCFIKAIDVVKRGGRNE